MYRYNMYSKVFLKFKFTLTFFFHHKTLRHFYSTSVFYPNECNSCKKQEWGWKKINKKMCPLRVVLLFFHVCFLVQKGKIISQGAFLFSYTYLLFLSTICQTYQQKLGISKLKKYLLKSKVCKNIKFPSKIFKPIAHSKSRLQQRQMECTCKKPWNVLLEQKPTRQFQFLSFFLFVLLESLLSFLIVVATILKFQAQILTRFRYVSNKNVSSNVQP